MERRNLIISLLGLLPAVAGYSWGSLDKKLYKNFPFSEERRLTIQPGTSSQGFGLRSLDAMRLQQVDFINGAEETILRVVDNPLIGAKLLSHQKLADQRERAVFSFTVNEVPLCRTTVSAHKLASGQILVNGALPDLTVGHWPGDSQWLGAREAFDLLKTHMVEEGLDVSQLAIIETERCFELINGEPREAWDMTVNDGALGWSGIVGTLEVYQFGGVFFDLKGTIRSFNKNPKDGKLIDYEVELVGSGKKLESEFFRTLNAAGDEATSSNGDFLFEKNDPRIAETTIFVNAQRTLEYFEELGYTWHGTRPLELNARATKTNSAAGDINNALYQPGNSTSTGLPTITIGEGDGVNLANLNLDMDVVSHEFGHHIVYQTLQDINTKTLVLHEGLADFFTFARSEDTCLGESICPSTSRACWIPNQCLRIADPDLKYGDDRYVSLGNQSHLKGQLVSGLLMDLVAKKEMALDNVARIAYKSVTLLNRDSGLHDLLVTLMAADLELNEGRNACKIYDTALDRGLGTLIDKLDCNKPNLSALQPDPSEPKESPVENAGAQKRKGGGGLCGVIGVSQSQSRFWLLLLLSPVVVLMGRRRRRRVRSAA